MALVESIPTKSKGILPPRSLTSSKHHILRWQLSEAETHLREMEEEANRISFHQHRELEALKSENKRHQAHLEDLRIRECMSQEEIRLLFSENEAMGDTPKQFMSTPSTHSKSLASSSAKYRAAQDLVLQKRVECQEAEAKVALLRQQLKGLLEQRRSLTQKMQSTLLAASQREFFRRQEQGQAREQLRDLEQHIGIEQERLNAIAIQAKDIRQEVETLLIAETCFENNYRIRESVLFERMKQIAFIIEVCNVIFQERQEKLSELEQLRSRIRSEDANYKRALEELAAVTKENEHEQEVREDKLVELRQMIQDSKEERIQLEREKEANQNLSPAPLVARGRRLTSVGREKRSQKASVGDTNALLVGLDKTHNTGVDDNPMQSDTATELEKYEALHKRLAELSGSTTLEGVVDYLDICAEKRFRIFEELNYLAKQLKDLDDAREQIQKRGRELSLHAGEGSQDRNATHTESKRLQEQLNFLKFKCIEQESCDTERKALLVHTIPYIESMFTSLSCNRAVLQERTGTENISFRTANECLALIDQRVEEYLIALTRYDQSDQIPHQQEACNNTGNNAAAVATRAQSNSAARTVLRRPNLFEKKKNLARSLVQNRHLPLTSDPLMKVHDTIPYIQATDKPSVAGIMHKSSEAVSMERTETLFSLKELRLIAKKRVASEHGGNQRNCWKET